jgi:hypothetical protein
MERNPEIETKINETLNDVKKVERLEAPAFFTEKTIQRLHASKPESSFSYSGLLKIAAIIVLLMVNAYTINYILSTNQDSTININSTAASVTDVVNDYQPNDATELAFENKITNE